METHRESGTGPVRLVTGIFGRTKSRTAAPHEAKYAHQAPEP